jgi:vacuolar-type H+-ATPase subunit H
MTIEDKARELMVKERKHDRHEHESLLSLTEQEIHEHQSNEAEEKARELVTESRLHDENLQENILSRAEEKIKSKVISKK